MKKVLIAIDESPIAQKIAKTGHALAKAMDAQTILLHVVSDVPFYSSLNYSPVISLDGLNNAIESVTWQQLEEVASNYLDNLKEVLGGQNIETLVKQGDFGNTILETAKEEGVNIIVMGTHNRRGLEKILVGSVAQKVLRHSLIPLFIVPTRT